jgi:branched-chain amino acid transport system ATP-binding protein
VGTVAIEFDKVVAGYGEFMILNELSLQAQSGKITLLLGPNGAGKSTVLKALFGLLKVKRGHIRLNGQDITGANSKTLLVQHGIAFVPQGRNLFGQLTAYENLELGGITLGMKTARERIPEVLALFPRIKERLHSKAASLSGGEQKQLEVGRALLLRPKVLLIDEPSIGLSPIVVQDVFKLLRQLAQGGTTVLMVEQNVKSALLNAFFWAARMRHRRHQPPQRPDHRPAVNLGWPTSMRENATAWLAQVRLVGGTTTHGFAPAAQAVRAAHQHLMTLTLAPASSAAGHPLPQRPPWQAQAAAACGLTAVLRGWW